LQLQWHWLLKDYIKKDIIFQLTVIN